MNGLLKEGDIIEVVAGMHVNTEIPKHIKYTNCKGDWEVVSDVVRVDNEFFSYLIGSYLVTSTETKRISDDMGMTMRTQTYTDIHMVYAVKTDNQRIEISFSQNGNLTDTNTDVKKIGRGRLVWTVEEEKE